MDGEKEVAGQARAYAREGVECVQCGDSGIVRGMYRCAVCNGIGPFDEAFPGQPPWKAGERSRHVGNTKVYRCYADYVDD